jgi:transposase-like protein
MKYRRSRFTPEFKLRALAALDASRNDVRGIAQEFDVSPKTLLDWRRQRQFILEQTEEYQRSQQVQRSMSIRIEMVMQQIIDSFPAKVESARLAESARTYLILRELHQGFASRQQRSNDLRDKLQQMVERFQAENEAAARTTPNRPQAFSASTYDDTDADADDFDDDPDAA